MKKTFLILMVFLLAACGGASEAEIAEAIAQTEAAKPTATVIPTSTATATPVPTQTPDMTATKEAEKEEISDYIDFVVDSFGKMEEARIELVAVANELVANPALADDEAWQEKAIAKGEAYHDAVVALSQYEDVPEKFIKVHEWFVEMANEAALFYENWEKGITEKDIDALDAATANIENIARYIANATDEVNKIDINS